MELPFTCKGGICGCCVGRVAEGEVDQSDVSFIGRGGSWVGAWSGGRQARLHAVDIMLLAHPHRPLQIADLSFVLTEDEIANGITMLCMARPVSDVVRVETQASSALCRCHHCKAGCLVLARRLVGDPPVGFWLQSDWGYALGSNNWKGPTGYITGKKIDPLMGRRWDEIQAETSESEA